MRDRIFNILYRVFETGVIMILAGYVLVAVIVIVAAVVMP
jgi:hypothetical protein